MAYINTLFCTKSGSCLFIFSFNIL
jgi:hypothetical protein